MLSPTVRPARSGPTVLTSSCHELATAGTRMFGDFFGGKSPIKVRIYDFALYFDAKQVMIYACMPAGSRDSAVDLGTTQPHICYYMYDCWAAYRQPSC